jgi:hyperosmotically inducible protein
MKASRLSLLSRFTLPLGAALCLGSFAAPARAASVPDSWITLETKLALVSEKHLTVDDVHVDTVNGRITLYGKVSTEARRRHAGIVARGMKGAKSVRNLLQVVRPPNEAAVAAADEQIKDQLTSLLEADPSLAGSHITVKSVDQGAVLLSGTALTFSAHLGAVESASSIAGVRSVASEIKAPDELTEAELARVANGTRDTARDSWTTADVKLRLLADGEVPALDVSVDTFHGVVSLFGMVPTVEAKAAAAADAQRVDSVVGVNDELQVVHEGGRKLVEAEDTVVKLNIEAAFKPFPQFKQVEVEVKNGRVHLTGTVGSGWDRLHAAIAAREAQGVRSVDDDLHITQPRG